MATVQASGQVRLLTVTPALLFLILLSALPLANLLALSFAKVTWAEGSATWDWVGLANYRALAKDALFKAGILNTLILVISATTLQVGIGLALALMVSRLGRGAKVYRTLFLLPILFGAGLGWFLGGQLGTPEYSPPPLVGFLASAGLGFLVGGGIVWAVRILGTLAFGREAMGMGDVHLLAAVGAALGWADPIRVFFIAPFLALAWIAGGRILSMFRKGTGSELPYGPHLAMATILVVYARPWLELAEQALLRPPG